MGAWIETGTKTWCLSFKKSHPSWVRGLKHKSQFIGGADATSHPSWVRGLKPYAHEAIVLGQKVAPLVGAWIETFSSYYYSMLFDVAPLVGAWIET